MRLIDADELRKEIDKQAYPHSDSTANDIYFSVLHLLADAPTVDAEPVVRCEDCQHSNLNGHCMEVGKKYCTIHKRQFHYDFFCSYGERKG